MFANSNPVKFCDPSGYSSTISDFLAGMAIGACIGFSLNALDYTITTLISDPCLTEHSVNGLLKATFVGFVNGAVSTNNGRHLYHRDKVLIKNHE